MTFFFFILFVITSLNAIADSPVILNVHNQRTILDNMNATESLRGELANILSIYKDSGAKIVNLLSPIASSYEQDKKFYSNYAGEFLDSSLGEHSYVLSTNTVSVIGGMFGICHAQAIQDIVKNYNFKDNDVSDILNINIPMNVVLVNGIPTKYNSLRSGATLLSMYEKSNISKKGADFFVSYLVYTLDLEADAFFSKKRILRTMYDPHDGLLLKNYRVF